MFWRDFTPENSMNFQDQFAKPLRQCDEEYIVTVF